MTLKTLVTAIMTLGFALPMTAGAAGDAQSAEQKFGMLDVNRDGAIDRQEAAADPAVAEAFDRIDAARSGQITLEDFAAWEEVSKSTEPSAAPAN